MERGTCGKRNREGKEGVAFIPSRVEVIGWRSEDLFILLLNVWSIEAAII